MKEKIMSKPSLVIWDYDWSLINTNSDVYVVEKLCPEYMDSFKELRKEHGWTKVMDLQMNNLSRAGVDRGKIEETMARVPFLPHVLECANTIGKLHTYHPKNFLQCVVSDANTEFIRVMLEHNNLTQSFPLGIHSNFGDWEIGEDGNDRLNVRPHHEQPHGCDLCPSNLCKGKVVEDLKNKVGNTYRLIYVGDGGGDFCPIHKIFNENDVACVRVGSIPSGPSNSTSFGLHPRIEKLQESHPVRCKVMRWNNGEDLRAIFDDLFASPSMITSTMEQ